MPSSFVLRRLRRAATALALLWASTRCDSSGMDMMMPEPEVPFDPVAPAAYASKVKNLLTSLPLTEAELTSVTADPSTLPALIDAWQALPEGRSKLISFFKLAFQQTQLSPESVNDVMPPNMGVDFSTNAYARTLRFNVEDSFARTALKLIDDDRPFTEAATSEQYMLTPALMALIAYQDAALVSDDGTSVSGRRNLATQGQSFQFSTTQDVVFTSASNIPVDQSANPSSPNFMRWTIPATGMYLKLPAGGNCTEPMVFDNTKGNANYKQQVLLNALVGTVFTCPPTLNPILRDTDFSAWKWVRIRRPNAGENPTAFFDIATLRSGTELVVTRPTVGFFSTLAFQGNWPTNVGNQHRVTANQTIIVALGRAFAIASPLPGAPLASSDVMHASTAVECNNCHWQLDPTRLVFRQELTLRGTALAVPPSGSNGSAFVFEDKVDPNVHNLSALGATLASHPHFAAAWAQKLCYFANSVACDETDPEFQRVVEVFVQSGFRFRTLLRELLSSPLVTMARRTQTFTMNPQPVSVARREHLCTAFNHRFAFPDVCNQNTPTTPTVLQAAVGSMALSIPIAGYSRGTAAPIMSSEPDLFFSASIENICYRVANELVDKMPTPKYASTSAMSIQLALDDLVATVMALPRGEARNVSARAVLQAHFDEAKASGLSSSDALKSTFILACMAPTSVAIGL